MEENDNNDLDVTESGGEFKQAANSVKSGAQKTKQTAQNVKKIAEKVSKNAQKTIAKAGKNIAQIASKLGPALPWIALAILIIIVVIGILAFFMSMPGMLTGKLKEIAQGIADWWQSLYTDQSYAYTNEEDVLETANYIKSMGYDLIGYGFIPANTIYHEQIKTCEELENEGYTDTDGDGIYKKADGSSSESYIGDDGYVYNGTTGKKIEIAGTYFDRYGIQYSSGGDETGATGTFETSGEITGFSSTVDDSLLRTYLMSDKRMFFIRNYDHSDSLFNAIHDIFVKDVSGDWAKGLLSIWKAENFKATEKYLAAEAGSITVDGESKTLKVKKGWTNNEMVYSMDGWSGRYGLSLEFLLSLHLATMAPELVSTMARGFDTEVQVYLDTVTDAKAIGYYYNEDEGTYLSNDELFDGYGLVISKRDAFDIMKKNKIRSKEEGEFACQYGIEPEIVYLNGKTGSEIDNTYKNVVQGYSVDYVEDILKDGYIADINSWNDLYKKIVKDGFVCNGNSGTHKITDDKGETTEIECDNTYSDAGEAMNEKLIYKIVDKINDALYYIKTMYPDYTWIDEDDSNTEKKASQYGYSYYINGTSKLKKDEEDTDRSASTTSEEDKLYSKNNRDLYNGKAKALESIAKLDEIIKMDKSYDDGGGLEFEICTFTSNDTNEEDRKELILSLFVYHTNVDKNYDMIVMVYEEPSEKERTEITTCYDYAVAESDTKNTTKTCSACRKYIKTLRSALNSVSDDDFETYIPYIARVVDSWFRDTYFVVPEENDVAIEDVYANHSSVYGEDNDKQKLTGNSIEFISVDDEYLEDTGEYWTEYEMNDDGTYVLYVLNDDGTIGDLWTETEEKAVEEGVKLTKKVVNTTKSEGGWSAYGTIITASSEKELVEVSDETPKAIRRVTNYSSSDGSYDKIIYYYLDQMGKVEQTEDGQRGITNSKIKKMFKIRKYYIYDGTSERSEAIYDDWKNVIENNGETCYNYYKDDKIFKETYENVEEGLKKEIAIELALDDYYYYKTGPLSDDPRNSELIGNININADSLSAFSILENTHTLDSDYAYRDFKELIVELNYFDKEDLSEKTPEIFTWVLPELQEQWPVRMIDKDENYYGTYIHSENAIKNIKENLGISEPEDGEEEESSSDEDSENIQQLKNAKGYVYAGETSSEDEEAEGAGTAEAATGEVVSPVTGEIIAYGTYDRINTDLVKYEGLSEEDAKETVGYIRIKVSDTEDLFDFVQGETTVGVDSEDDTNKYTNAKALNAYYEEYEGVCDGYIVTIDGIELLNGVTDLDGLKGLDESNFKVTESFEANTTPNIVDDTQEKKNQQKENAKAEAPAVVKNGDKIYVREGTIIGYTTKNVNIKDSSMKDYSYIRIILRNEERSLRENVEEYFDLPVSMQNGFVPVQTDFPEEFIFWLGTQLEGACEGSYDWGDKYGFEILKDGAGHTTAFGLTKYIADIATKGGYPDFEAHLASNDGVPKQEAQNVFLLVLESARESILNQIDDTSKLSESMLDALVEFNHLNPSQTSQLCQRFNTKGELTESDFMSLVGGTNANYVATWTKRAKTRANLALKNEYHNPYNDGMPKYKFLSQTPWTDFCNGAASSTLYKFEY